MSSRTHRVWIEDPPIAGKREFVNQQQALDRYYLTRQLLRLNLLNERASRTERDRIRTELNVTADTRWVVDPAPHLDIHTVNEDWYRQWITGNTTSTTAATNAIHAYMTSTGQLYRAEVESSHQTVLRQPVAAPAIASVEDDMYLIKDVKYARSYIWIDDFYWTTDGRIPPEAVARVLSRYYNTPELIRRLHIDAEYGFSTLHPDPDRMQGRDKKYTMPLDSFISGTRGLDYMGHVFVWHNGRWLQRIAKSGEWAAFKTVDPHKEFEA